MAKLLTPAVLVAVLSLFVSAPSSACQYCKYQFRCIGDYCWLDEFCKNGSAVGQPGFVECQVDSFGYCSAKGEICRWAAKGSEPFRLLGPVGSGRECVGP